MQDSICMQQVHGNNVVFVTKDDIGKTISDCDGLITTDPNIKLVVRTADCLPITVNDINGRIHGVIHAGWRGLENKIIGKMVDLINTKFYIINSELLINIGSHICQKHYEIKDDVAQFFTEIKIKDGKKYLNLEAEAVMQFVDLGVKRENIKIDKRCTFEDPNLFSYRLNKTAERIQTVG